MNKQSVFTVWRKDGMKMELRIKKIFVCRSLGDRWFVDLYKGNEGISIGNYTTEKEAFEVSRAVKQQLKANLNAN